MSQEVSGGPLSWRALSALLLAMLSITVGYGIVLPILPFLVERLAGPGDTAALSSHTGLLTGTYILAIFLFAPLWGRLSDRQGRRPVMLVGLIGFAATVGLFALVERLPLIYLGRFLDGAFAAAITPAVYALIGDHAPSKEWRAHRFALINVLAGELAAMLVARIPEISTAHCLIASRIGSPITHPAVLHVKIATKDGSPANVLKDSVEEVAATSLARLPSLVDGFVAGTISVF